MAKILKPGDKLQVDDKQWVITEIGEDNEGQRVYHLKHGSELSVLKESHLPKDENIAQKQRSHP